MSLIAVAQRAGLPQQDLEEILDGKATTVLADHMGTSVTVVQEFIDGVATQGISSALGIPMISLQPFATMLEEKGRIGLLLGRLLGQGGAE